MENKTNNQNTNELKFSRKQLTKDVVKQVLGEREFCELEPSKKCNYCGECLMCDLDPNKICNNCGKCLDEYNTDEKGYVSIKIDKIIAGDDMGLDDLYKQYGLDDDEEPEQIKPKNDKK